jgi:hypothetical protein
MNAPMSTEPIRIESWWARSSGRSVPNVACRRAPFAMAMPQIPTQASTWHRTIPSSQPLAWASLHFLTWSVARAAPRARPPIGQRPSEPTTRPQDFASPARSGMLVGIGFMRCIPVLRRFSGVCFSVGRAGSRMRTGPLQARPGGRGRLAFHSPRTPRYPGCGHAPSEKLEPLRTIGGFPPAHPQNVYRQHPIQPLDSTGLSPRLTTRSARWAWSCTTQRAAGFAQRSTEAPRAPSRLGAGGMLFHPLSPVREVSHERRVSAGQRTPEDRPGNPTGGAGVFDAG